MNDSHRLRASTIVSALMANSNFIRAAKAHVETVQNRLSSTDFAETIKRFSDGQPGNVYSRTGSAEADGALDILAQRTYLSYPELKTDTQVRRAVLAQLLYHFSGAGAAGDFEIGANPTNQKGNTMNDSSKTASVKVESVTRVTIPSMGVGPIDAKLLSTDQLIAGISATEKQIKELKGLETPSAAITKAITKLEEGAKALADILDARAEKDEASNG